MILESLPLRSRSARPGGRIAVAVHSLWSLTLVQTWSCGQSLVVLQWTGIFFTGSWGRVPWRSMAPAGTRWRLPWRRRTARSRAPHYPDEQSTGIQGSETKGTTVHKNSRLAMGRAVAPPNRCPPRLLSSTHQGRLRGKLHKKNERPAQPCRTLQRLVSQRSPLLRPRFLGALVFYGLDVEFKLDLHPDGQAAASRILFQVSPKFLTREARLGCEHDALGTPEILLLPFESRLQRDFFGDPMQREIARHVILFTVFGNRLAGEGRLGKLLGREKVG